jgi:tetratricopeptide (TPR) repeat protein
MGNENIIEQMRQFAALLLTLALFGAPATAQIDPKTALLERTGWDALKAGNGSAAAEAFRAAITGDPKNARLHLGAGVAAYLERRDADAKSALERALDLDPRLSEARMILGKVLYRSGDLPGAIRAFERFVADVPGDTDSTQTLERWRREADLHDRMRHSLNERFTVSFEGPQETTLAAEALASLDRAYWRIGETLSTFPNQPISIVLYTAQDFRDITRSPAWAAAAYDGTIRVPVRGALNNTKELDRVLAHEFTHALVRTLATRGVPTWLNEGLAAALESDDVEWARDTIRRADRPMSLTALRSSFGRLTGDQAQVAYATSALAVRRLLDEAGGFAVANLLRDLGEGVDLESAFLHRIQQSFASFQSDAP